MQVFRRLQVSTDEKKGSFLNFKINVITTYVLFATCYSRWLCRWLSSQVGSTVLAFDRLRCVDTPAYATGPAGNPSKWNFFETRKHKYKWPTFLQLNAKPVQLLLRRGKYNLNIAVRTGHVPAERAVQSRLTVEDLSIRDRTQNGKVVSRCGDKKTRRELRSAIRLATKQARSDVDSGARLRNKWSQCQRKMSISRRDERARTKPVTGGTCGPTVCRGDAATIWGQVSDIQAEFKRLFAWLQTLDGQWRLSNCSQARCNKTKAVHFVPLAAPSTALCRPSLVK